MRGAFAPGAKNNRGAKSLIPAPPILHLPNPPQVRHTRVSNESAQCHTSRGGGTGGSPTLKLTNRPINQPTRSHSSALPLLPLTFSERRELAGRKGTEIVVVAATTGQGEASRKPCRVKTRQASGWLWRLSRATSPHSGWGRLFFCCPRC